MDRQTEKKLEQNDCRYWAIIPAAGLGRRMGATVAKQYLRIDHRTILELTIERLHRIGRLEKIVLVLHPEDSSWTFLNTSHYSNIVTAAGGEERCHSVLNGLEYLKNEAADNDWILVHDAVRPCVSVGDIEKLISVLADDPVGGILASRVRETVKRAGGDTILETLNREDLWLAATPQMFRYRILHDAMEAAIGNNLQATDEAAAVEAMGLNVKLVTGRSDNIKVTHPEDIELARFILEQEQV
ncbi:MAG: 2-C-methyl-D-erythritol 4-phosphate cytidylyltransferase [Pseudohongiellaceae bacterium]